MNCAVIGFGNVGYKFSKGLRAEGFGDIYFYKHHDTPPFTGQLKERVEATGVIYRSDIAALLASSTLVLSCVVGSAALAVVEEAAPFLTPEHLFVDLNTTSPAIKKRMAQYVEQQGARFVDGAIMGPVDALEHKVPISVCGTGAKAFAEAMQPVGMVIDVIDGEAGSAAAIKMLRSIFQKGLMCLFLECFVAARQCGVQEEVMESISRTFDGVPLRTMVSRLVPNCVRSARRMSSEMTAVQTVLDEMQMSSFMSSAAGTALNWYAALGVDTKGGEADGNAILDAVHEAVRQHKA